MTLGNVEGYVVVLRQVETVTALATFALKCSTKVDMLVQRKGVVIMTGVSSLIEFIVFHRFVCGFSLEEYCAYLSHVFKCHRYFKVPSCILDIACSQFLLPEHKDSKFIAKILENSGIVPRSFTKTTHQYDLP